MGKAEDKSPTRTPDTVESGRRHPGLATWRARLTGPTARKGVWALLDQGVLSASNFSTGILLARLCSREEYGSYVLALSIMFLANGVHSALIVGPMSVLGAGKGKQGLRDYATSLALAQTILGALVAVVVVGVSLAMGGAERDAGFPGALLGMGVAVLLVHSREFFRRLLFTRLTPHKALLGDLVFCLAQFGGLIALWRLGGGTWSPATPGHLTARNAFLWMGGSSFLGAAVGLVQSRAHVFGGLGGIKQALKETWRFGRWGLGSTLLRFASSNIYVLLVGAFGRAGAAAGYAAPMLLSAPANVFLLGFASLLSPLMAKKVSEGEAGVKLARYFILALPPVVWCSLVLIAPEIVAQASIGPSYLAQEPIFVARLIAAGYILNTVAWFTSLVLMALRRPEAGFYANLLAALSTVVVGVLLVWSIGPVGAALGFVITVFCRIAVNLYFLSRHDGNSAAVVT